MKNLMVYISPTGSFDNPRYDLTANDAAQLAKIQVENSLALGWKKEDVMLFTNFAWQYGGFGAKILKDVEFFERKPQVSKINAIIKLFEKGVIKKRVLYWFHDLDAFQLQPINKGEMKIQNNEIAITDFGRSKTFMSKPRWHMASFFFKSGSLDIFRGMTKICYEKGCDEEEALTLLVKDNPKIKKRVKRINETYNFIGFDLKSSYKKATKPLKVVHFHPDGYIRQLKVERPIDFFLGKNELGIPLITERLIRIFRFHRIK